MQLNHTAWKRVLIWAILLLSGNILLSILAAPDTLTTVVILQFLAGWLVALFVALIFRATLPEHNQLTWLEFILVWIVFTLVVYSTFFYNEKHGSGLPIG